MRISTEKFGMTTWVKRKVITHPEAFTEKKYRNAYGVVVCWYMGKTVIPLPWVSIYNKRRGCSYLERVRENACKVNVEHGVSAEWAWHWRGVGKEG